MNALNPHAFKGSETLGGLMVIRSHSFLAPVPDNDWMLTFIPRKINTVDGRWITAPGPANGVNIAP